MIQKTLTFSGIDRASFSENEFNLPEGFTALTMDCSTVSPGTELMCIRDNETFQPGYIMVGHSADGKHYFVFPSMEESSAAHCNVRAVGPKSLLIPLPDDLPLEYAGFLRFINIGMHPYCNLDTLPRKVAVTGLGPVGNLAAQTGILFGCEVIGTDPSEKRRALAEQCGISTLSPEAFAECKDQFELVIDTVSASATLSAAARALKENGTCCMVGCVKPGALSAADLCQSIWTRNLRFVSGWEMKNPFSATERNLYRGIEWLLRDRYCIKPLVTGIIPPDLKAIGDAYRALAKDPENHFSYVIDWRK